MKRYREVREKEKIRVCDKMKHREERKRGEMKRRKEEEKQTRAVSYTHLTLPTNREV